MFRPTSRLNSADLPTFGRPTIETEPTISPACLAEITPLTLAQFRVGVAFGRKLSDTVADIDHPGDECEKSCCENDVDQRQDADLQHDPGNCRHLEHRRHFARPARPDPDFAVENMENGAADKNHGVPRNHQDQEPLRNLPTMRTDLA